MKKLNILLLTILISFNSYGEWIEIAEDANGNKFYIDIETIKENNGNVYFWDLTDYIKPTTYGRLSASMYKEGDCNINRYRTLSFIFFDGSMGKGQGDQQKPQGDNGDWRYPGPKSIGYNILRFACNSF